MVPIEKVNKVQMGNQDSTKPLENLQLDIEKANVQVNGYKPINWFIDSVNYYDYFLNPYLVNSMLDRYHFDHFVDHFVDAVLSIQQPALKSE